MDRGAKQIFERLGASGLARALDDLLDPSDLVRLANACGIKYPGMRTQSQKRERLVTDLVAKSKTHAAARTSILRTLRKEAAGPSKDWEALTAEDKARRLGDEAFLQTDGNLGLHMFLLASATDASELDGFAFQMAHLSLLRMTGNGAGSKPDPAKSPREENRLKKKTHELEKKVRHLETQLTKSRESQRGFKQDLIQRKGELAESRMLVERLHSDLAEARAAAKAAVTRSGGGTSDKAVADLTKSVRSLVSEQKKLTHRLGQWSQKLPKGITKEVAAPVLDVLHEMRGELARERKEAKKDAESQARVVETLRGDLRGLDSPPVTRKKKTRQAKKISARGQSPRVGVFIDVQNMYYSARQLKGKLDFDALLEAAVRDRRLCRATAYVVVSKETDQSQFIAMLEKRGIEVRRKPLQVRTDGSMKGDWDMELAFDILDAAPKLDVVVLVSGDGDFTSMVKRVKSMGPRVEVIAFPRTTAKSLLQAADKFQPLDRKFMIYKRSSKPAPTREVPAQKPSKSASAEKNEKSDKTEKSEKSDKGRVKARS